MIILILVKWIKMIIIYKFKNNKNNNNKINEQDIIKMVAMGKEFFKHKIEVCFFFTINI